MHAWMWRLTEAHAVLYVNDRTVLKAVLDYPRFPHKNLDRATTYANAKGKVFAWQFTFPSSLWNGLVRHLGRANVTYLDQDADSGARGDAVPARAPAPVKQQPAAVAPPASARIKSQPHGRTKGPASRTYGPEAEKAPAAMAGRMPQAATTPGHKRASEASTAPAPGPASGTAGLPGGTGTANASPRRRSQALGAGEAPGVMAGVAAEPATGEASRRARKIAPGPGVDAAEGADRQARSRSKAAPAVVPGGEVQPSSSEAKEDAMQRAAAQPSGAALPEGGAPPTRERKPSSSRKKVPRQGAEEAPPPAASTAAPRAVARPAALPVAEPPVTPRGPVAARPVAARAAPLRALPAAERLTGSTAVAASPPKGKAPAATRANPRVKGKT